MTWKTMRIPNGILTYSEVDLEFEFEGKKTYMEFHHYLGPSFYTMKTEEEYLADTSKFSQHEDWIYPDDSERYKPLWDEFYKWFNKPEQQHLHYKGEN